MPFDQEAAAQKQPLTHLEILAAFAAVELECPFEDARRAAAFIYGADGDLTLAFRRAEDQGLWSVATTIAGYVEATLEAADPQRWADRLHMSANADEASAGASDRMAEQHRVRLSLHPAEWEAKMALEGCERSARQFRADAAEKRAKAAQVMAREAQFIVSFSTGEAA